MLKTFIFSVFFILACHFQAYAHPAQFHLIEDLQEHIEEHIHNPGALKASNPKSSEKINQHYQHSPYLPLAK